MLDVIMYTQSQKSLDVNTFFIFLFDINDLFNSPLSNPFPRRKEIVLFLVFFLKKKGIIFH